MRNPLYQGALWQKENADFVSKSAFLYGEDVKIYATLESFEESVQMIQTISPLLDPKMNQDELNEVLEYISEYKEANGKYYGNLSLTLFGSNETNYELMIKTD